jgi:hypothetical protein
MEISIRVVHERLLAENVVPVKLHQVTHASVIPIDEVRVVTVWMNSMFIQSSAENHTEVMHYMILYGQRRYL